MTVGIYHFSISISFITEHTIISLPCMLRRVARKTYHSFKQARMSSNDSHKQAIPSTVFDTAPEKTLFNKFVTGEFKCNKVYEDDHVLAFHDINPQAPTHILIIPKIKKIGRVHEATDADAAELGQLFIAAGKIATQLNLLDGTIFFLSCFFRLSFGCESRPSSTTKCQLFTRALVGWPSIHMATWLK